MKKISCSLMFVLLILSLLTSMVVPVSAVNEKVIQCGVKYSAQVTDDVWQYSYKFTVSSASTVKIDLNSNIQGQLKVKISDVNGYELDEDDAYWNNTTGVMKFSRNYAVTKGTYYLDIYAPFSGDVGTFSFKLEETSVGESFPELEGGSNNYSSSADIIQFNKTYKGQIALNDESDFYKISVPTKQKVKINLSSAIEWIYIDIYDVYGDNVFYDSPGRNGVTGLIEYSEEITLSEGIYYIAISQSLYSSEEYLGNYSFKVSTVLSTPKLTKIANGKNYVQINWGKVTGADSYKVYRKVSGGSYKYLGKTTKTAYADKTAKSGTKYYYVVKAVNEAGNSEKSASKGITFVGAPVIKTPSSSKSGITVKWGKVGGADGYIVYRKTGSGSYEKLAKVKGGTKVSYLDKSAKKGKTYSYKVFAYKGSTKSAGSAVKTIKDKY